MPWKESSVVNQRTEFVLHALAGKVEFVDLCREYGISRKTGYKWKQRFLEHGNGARISNGRQRVSGRRRGARLVPIVAEVALAPATKPPPRVGKTVAIAAPGQINSRPCQAVRRPMGETAPGPHHD